MQHMGAADTLKLFLDIFLNSVYVLKTNFTFLDLFFFTYIRIFFFYKNVIFTGETRESEAEHLFYVWTGSVYWPTREVWRAKKKQSGPEEWGTHQTRHQLRDTEYI